MLFAVSYSTGLVTKLLTCCHFPVSCGWWIWNISRFWKICRSIKGCSWLQTTFFSTHQLTLQKGHRQRNALASISNYLDVSARRILYNSFTRITVNLCGISVLQMANTTSLVISRLWILLLEVYKFIYHLNPKCINGLFEIKPTNYSLRNPVKLVWPMKRTSTYGLGSVPYTEAKLRNDLSPFLSNDVEIEDFKSLVATLSSDHLDPTFTYAYLS